MTPQNLQMIGLMYDATGILVLGVPAVFRMVDEIASQSGTYFDYNVHLVHALAKARVDTTVGSILLLFGFVIQALSLGYDTTHIFRPFFPRILCIFLATWILLYFSYLRDRFSNLLTTRVKLRLDSLPEKHGQ